MQEIKFKYIFIWTNTYDYELRFSVKILDLFKKKKESSYGSAEHFESMNVKVKIEILFNICIMGSKFLN